ncbi:MAG: hypothetical protein FJ135_03435 [Deltaproteobacteria bacterium]|nr:hypothetical protein [Deltaproteobacteria bacterium]
MAKTKSSTPSGDVSSRDSAVQQKLEALKKEHANLHNLKITTEANIRNLEENLAKLRAAAEKEYGTSDIAALEEILEARRRENETRVAQYEEHVREIKDSLAAMEEQQTEAAS